nr:VWA domain-containing protein [Oceanococcus sp. HetDA_MAG_MS8]
MMWPADVTLLRPAALWLLAATPALLWLLRTRRRRRQSSPWDAVIAPELRAAVLTQPTQSQRRGWLQALSLGLAWVCAVLALAGPSFGQTEVPTVPPSREAVIALGLSPSLRATDLSPDRLTRARLSLEEWLLAQDDQRVGMVSFASRAYRVSPLTEDMPTLRHLLQALSPDLMPGGGHNTLAGLRLAASMFSEGSGQRHILMVVDQGLRPGTRELARELAMQGIQTHVLSVGTTGGAPIPLANGRFATDGRGQLLMAAVDEQAHQELAQAGQGRWASISDWDSQRWADLGAGSQGQNQADPARESTIARDDGIWFLLPLSLWLAWRLSQNGLLIMFLTLGMSLAWRPQTALAADSDWWANPKRQAVQRWINDPESVPAEELPSSWAGRALLEQGRPEAAAQALSQGTSLSDRYNAALALARANQLESALEGFAQILEDHPEFEAAAHNYQVLQEVLKQREQDEQENEQDNSGQGSEQQSGDDGQPPEGQPPESAENQQQSGEGEDKAGEQNEQNSESAQNASSEDQNQASTEPPPNTQPEEQAERQDQGQSQAEQSEADDAAEPLASLTDPQANPEQADEAERQIRQWLNRVDSDPARLLRERFRRLDLRAPTAEKDPES